MMQLPQNIPLEFAKGETAWTDNSLSSAHLNGKNSVFLSTFPDDITPIMSVSMDCAENGGFPANTAHCDCCFYGLVLPLV